MTGRDDPAEILPALRQVRREADVEPDPDVSAAEAAPRPWWERLPDPLSLPGGGVTIESLPDPKPFGPLEVVAVPSSRTRRHRPPGQLEAKLIRKCENELKKRKRAGRPKSGPLTLKAIAERGGLPRTRVTQMEQLMEIGWPLLRSHPDFPADRGYVRLPSWREAALLLRSR